MNPFSLIRFKKTVPNPPDATPGDHVDMFYSASESKLVARDADGNPVRFDGGGGTLRETSGEPGTALSSGVAVAAGSLSLPAGIWDVSGHVIVTCTDPLAGDRILACINTSLASFDGVFQYATVVPVPASFGDPISATPFQRRITLAAAATVYLNVQVVFAGPSASLDAFVLSARPV